MGLDNMLESGFVRLATILEVIPVSRSTLWEMVARGDFPKPVKLSRRVTAWRCSDIIAFIDSRAAAPVSDQQSFDAPSRQAAPSR